MELVKSVKIGWKWLAVTINGLIDGVNARTLIQGDKMLFRETPGGVLISADIPAIQALIDKTVAAAVAANPPGGGSGGGGSGGGGGGGIVPSVPGPDLSGTGDSSGWDFLGPLDATNGWNLYPNQSDLSPDIVGFSVNRHYIFGGSELIQGYVTVNADGTTGGPGFFQLYSSPGVPSNPAFWYTISYQFASGGSAPGPVSPAFTVPTGGGNIILGNHTLFIPN